MRRWRRTIHRRHRKTTTSPMTTAKATRVHGLRRIEVLAFSNWAPWSLRRALMGRGGGPAVIGIGWNDALTALECAGGNPD